jgi:hypothetical protein
MIKTPELFEKYLQYAMALGVEKNWVLAFEDIYGEPPEWYWGPYGHGFPPRKFVSDLGHTSSRAGAIMASAPAVSVARALVGAEVSPVVVAEAVAAFSLRSPAVPFPSLGTCTTS